MNQQITRSLSLFDLLARRWELSAEVKSIRFATDGSSAAFSCDDGTVAIARTEDREPPEDRIRVSADLGQSTIRPRSGPPEPLVISESFGPKAPPLAAIGAGDFLVGAADGLSLVSVANGTRSAGVVLDGAVAELDHAPASGLIAASSGSEVVIVDGNNVSVRLPFESGRVAKTLAFSPDGRRLAVIADRRLEIWNVGGEMSEAVAFDLPEGAGDAAWNGDGTWLALPLAAGGFMIVDVEGKRIGAVGDFPAGTRSVAWSSPANALAVSGAYRIAAWSMERPPLEDPRHGALVTGRAGLVVVETIAAHPRRPLVAAGYADGKIVIAEIGARDELLVRPSGGAITAFAWSPDGRHLAVADADGKASLVTFPNQLFK